MRDLGPWGTWASGRTRRWQRLTGGIIGLDWPSFRKCDTCDQDDVKSRHRQPLAGRQQQQQAACRCCCCWLNGWLDGWLDGWLLFISRLQADTPSLWMMSAASWLRAREHVAPTTCRRPRRSIGSGASQQAKGEEKRSSKITHEERNPIVWLVVCSSRSDNGRHRVRWQDAGMTPCLCALVDLTNGNNSIQSNSIAIVSLFCRLVVSFLSSRGTHTKCVCVFTKRKQELARHIVKSPILLPSAPFLGPTRAAGLCLVLDHSFRSIRNAPQWPRGCRRPTGASLSRALRAFAADFLLIWALPVGRQASVCVWPIKLDPFWRQGKAF